jgi:hypothetical protein
MSSLAVIGTFFGRHAHTLPLLQRILKQSSLVPDELWILCEEEEDVVQAEWALACIHRPPVIPNIQHVPTPKIDGRYSVIPYSNKINWALDRTNADYICFLDNFSMPHPRKYDLMKSALDQHPTWGATYCAQRRLGHVAEYWDRTDPIPDCFCILNYTQVMYRRTPDRWTLDLEFSSPDIADALFWRDLNTRFGAMYPASTSGIMLDWHYMKSHTADGL